jgi:tetratricopeptide (TPR) repeat protein
MPFHRHIPILAVACALLLAGCGSEAQPLTNTTSLPINYAPSATVADLNGGAIATAQAAVDAKPQDAAAWYRLGNALSVAANEITDNNLRQASYNKAIAAYLRALELDPADGAAMHNLGTAYLQIGKLADARKQFETALTVDAQDPKTLYMLGTIYLQEDPFGSSQSNQRAREKFEAALQADPKLAVAHVGLAQVYLNEGNGAQALENARKGVELSGDQVDPFTYWQLAQAQCATGDAAGGTETLQRILAAAVPNAMFNDQVRSLMSVCK